MVLECVEGWTRDVLQVSALAPYLLGELEMFAHYGYVPAETGADINNGVIARRESAAAGGEGRVSGLRVRTGPIK